MAQRGSLRWRIVRPLFELLYRSRILYWLASTIPFAGQWRVWQRLVLSRLRGRDVLEVGCGTGTLLLDMLRAGYACQALDRSPQMVAATGDRLRRAGYPSRIVRQGEVQRLPFPAASFDAVVSTFPTDYIADPAALREIERVLRPGGRLVVVLGAALIPRGAALLPFAAIQRLVYGPQPGRRPPQQPGASSSIRSTTSGLARLLRDAGLEPSSEAVEGPFWVAQLYFGEKSAGPSGPAAR